MAITWNIDEARATIQAQMAEANRLDAVIDELAAVRDEYRAEVARLREQVAALTALWQQAIDADILDDPHELEAAIVKASALLNWPPPDDYPSSDEQDRAFAEHYWPEAE